MKKIFIIILAFLSCFNLASANVFDEIFDSRHSEIKQKIEENKPPFAFSEEQELIEIEHDYVDISTKGQSNALVVPDFLEVQKVEEKVYISCFYKDGERFDVNVIGPGGFIHPEYYAADFSFYHKKKNGRYVYVPESDEFVRVDYCDFSNIEK